MKTVPLLKDITEADAKRWGTGQSYKNHVRIGCDRQVSGFCITIDRTFNKSLPKFTWDDVMRWKIVGKGKNAPMIWGAEQIVQWTVCNPTCGYVTLHNFVVNWMEGNYVPEPIRDNNFYNLPIYGDQLFLVVP